MVQSTVLTEPTDMVLFGPVGPFGMAKFNIALNEMSNIEDKMLEYSILEGVRFSAADKKKVAVIIAYTYPNLQNDCNRFCTQFGLPQLTSANFSRPSFEVIAIN